MKPQTSVDAEITAIFIKGFKRRYVRRTLHNLIDPLNASDHLVTLLLREHRGTFVLHYVLVSVHTNDQLVSK